MEKRQLQFTGLLHGGDYNPEQWLDRPDILAEDIRLMQKAHVNCVTLGVFAWSMYEPREGEYDFGWLLGIMDNLYAAGISTILATPSGARPAWLDKRYPDARRVAANGLRNRHGMRHNHCMTSPDYRAKTAAIDTALARATKGHPGLLAWHISNEYGGECFCPLCAQAFRAWLKNRYKSIDALNHAWWATFWSRRYGSFDEVEPPFENGEQSMPGLKLDWRRFTTYSTADFMKAEIAAVRAVTPELPVTTNFMRIYEGLDYHELAKELDIISWDAYPEWHSDARSEADEAANVAFGHALMRGLGGGAPFLLMESTPSLVNWQRYNKLKRPGVNFASGLLAVACGADSVQYFQWRKGRGAFEQYHGAAVGHDGGSDTRVFREIEQLGATLQQLAGVQGARVKAEAAFVYDWDNRWAVKDMVGLSSETKHYDDTVYAMYRHFARHGVAADVVPQDADFSQYKLLVLPMHYLLKPGFAARLKAFVQGGGQLLATYLLGYVDESTLCWLGGFPGDGLKEVFGVEAAEIDTLYPGDGNTAIFADGERAAIRDYCELLQPSTAQTIARYGQDFYTDTPVITKNAYGSGCAWYMGARLDDAGTEKLLRQVWQAAGISAEELPAGIQHHTRTAADGTVYHFYFNMAHTAQTVALPRDMRCLAATAPQGGLLCLAPWGASVLAQPPHGAQA